MTTKHDQSKPRFSLIPVGTLNAVIRVLEFGASKYAENNWQTVPDARRRYYDAMRSWRHTPFRKLCVEALPVLHNQYHQQAKNISYADLTTEKSFTRFDDSKNFDLHDKVSLTDQPLLETKSKKKDGDVSTQMRMTSELLIAGVTLAHEIDLVNVDEIELGAVHGDIRHLENNSSLLCA